jgi:hypothetical protein
MSIDLGDPVPLSIEVKDPAGALANGGTVALTVTQPDGTAAGPFTVSPTTTGVYDYTFTPSQVGRHQVRWVSTGANAASYSDAFDVSPGDLGSIISLADAKAQLLRGSTREDPARDEELRLYLSSVTALVEHECGAIIPTSHTEIVEADDTIVLAKSPVMSLTSVVQTFPDVGALCVPTYVLDGPSGMLRQQPFSFANWGFDYGYGGSFYHYRGRLTVTYVAGRPVVPPALQTAARIILAELWTTRRLAGPKPASGGEQEQMLGREMIPEEAVLLMAPYRRAPRVA